MNHLLEYYKYFLKGIFLSVFIILSYNSVLAQSAFNRNDNYDFRGEHYLAAGGSSVDNFNLFIGEDSTDFRKFKLHIKKDRLHLSGVWLANQYRIDMNNDGTWEQGWTTSNELTVSYTYPNPPNGISADHTVKIEIQYQENPCCGTVNRTKYIPITIFSTTRVYVDSDNNSFIQLRDEDPTAKIPVLMVEGFDPLNEKFPEIYYNLTGNLVNVDLYPNSYEVFILNFNNGGRDLRLNADVLMKAIEKIHEICPNYKIALAGLSMGGPIGRYALAKKESQGGEHHIGLFLSYDSPQWWAHVSPDLQDWIKIQNPNEGAIGELQSNLQSVGAKQMLYYNTYDPTHTYRLSFYNELNGYNGDGYPHQSYNVAVSNGNFNATYGYGSVGRHLMTMKINDNLIKDVPAVQLDCGAGSMITNITTKRFGDIFNNPFIHIWYELQIIFNPSYTPTYSALDLVNPNINPITGDITSYERSKFDSCVVQTTPLQHHELSTLTRNTIMDWLNKDFNIGVNYSLPEEGSVNPDNYQVNILHGIPITVQPQNLNINGKQITYNFWKWEDGNTTNPRTFYTSHDVSHAATMKGIGISNNINAFSSNSQKKLVRTSNGYLHRVYESMGYVWYEMSTDNGATWTIQNNEKPISSNDAKLPAIDFSSTSQNEIIIVWQEKYNFYDVETFKIRMAYYGRPGSQLVFRDVYDESVSLTPNAYTFNTNPVIAWGNNKILVAWQEQGIVYKYGYVDNYGPTVWYTTGDYGAWITGTDNNSTNPTIAIRKDGGATTFHLAWQQSTSAIKYCSLTPNAQNIITVSSTETPSSGSGFNYNKNSSVSITSGGYPTLVWIGSIYESATTQVTRRTKTSGGWSGTFGKYGANVNSPTEYNSIIVWSENNANKLYRPWSSIRTLSTVGSSVQVSTGGSMYAVAYRQYSPYDFQTSPNVITLAKENSIVNQCGREGIITKGEAEFYFILADVTTNNEAIKFVEVDDTSIFRNTGDLNQHLITNSFALDETSSLSFSIAYGTTDSLRAINELKNNTSIQFKIELVDANTNEILGQFDNVKTDINNICSYAERSYRVNTNGIGKRLIKLVVTAKPNFKDGSCYLADILNETDVLGKNNSEDISFSGGEVITAYDLFQNYPNPFNPVTTITYQIPKEGLVTLKIYDVLGNEIKALVNEYRATGKYDVNFDAGNLASGVYIYRLKAGNYVSNKKMLLLK